MTHHRGLLAAALAAASVIALSGCATPAAPGGASSAGDAPPGASLGSLWPAPPTQEVVGQGTVLDVDGDARLCLGAVAESYPPQCSGLPITNWSWDGVEGAETAGTTTWGAYAVQGTYDGEEFTVTQPPVMLALYDPMVPTDRTGGTPGKGTEDELLAIQEELPDRLHEAYLGSVPDDGRLWVDVIWDDGTWQDAADADYGADKVVVRSALRPVEG